MQQIYRNEAPYFQFEQCHRAIYLLMNLVASCHRTVFYNSL